MRNDRLEAGSKRLRADCLHLGGNWQAEDHPGQEGSAGHLCGRVSMQMRLAFSESLLSESERWAGREGEGQLTPVLTSARPAHGLNGGRLSRREGWRDSPELFCVFVD